MTPDQTDPRAVDAVMADAIEHALFQGLADALNRLSEWGVDPLLGLADRLGVNGIAELDPQERGHWLVYVPPFTPDPDRPGEDVPFGWTVTTREDGGDGR